VNFDSDRVSTTEQLKIAYATSELTTIAVVLNSGPSNAFLHADSAYGILKSNICCFNRFMIAFVYIGINKRVIVGYCRNILHVYQVCSDSISQTTAGHNYDIVGGGGR